MDKLLKELIAIPSVCGDHKQDVRIIALLERHLRELGLHIEQFSANNFPSIVATTQKTKTPQVMLYAHLDVVSAPETLFKLRYEDGKYYGRGVLDMKSAASAYLHVLREMRHVLPNYDIGVMFTTDEEYFGEYGAGVIAASGYMPGVCIMPDSSFNTSWDIEVSAKGCWFANITALGISAHGSRPWEGDSATFKLIKALDEVADLFKEAQKPDTATLNIGTIQGGKSINQIPASAMATLDIRYQDMRTFRSLKQSIEKICNKHSVTLNTVRKESAPTANDINHPLIAAFAKHIELQTGVEPKPFYANGTSDARFFNALGVPCILTSPPGGEAHSNDEWLDKVGYEQFQIILRDYLEEVAKIALISPDKTATDALTIKQ